jgi:hypothetical protein
MDRIELRNLAIEKLNSKEVKNIKKQLCQSFIDRKQKKDCMTAFDKSFIKSFIATKEKYM